jgi:uncharacterized protein YndB with AHSA1/START domain
MNSQNKLEARVSRAFSNPAEQVFDAWLTPEVVGRWMFGPAIRDEEVISIEIDPRVGGAFSFLVKRQALVIDHIGTYLTIDRPRRLEFNWGVKGMSDSSKVSITIEPQDSGCTLTLVHELHPDWIEYLQRSIDGWGDMLRVLGEALAEKS